LCYSAEESAHSEAFRIPRKSQFRSSERNRTERDSAKKLSFTELAPHGLYNYSDIEHYYWNFGLPSFVLSTFIFRGMVRNGIPTVCFYIFSTERNPSCFLFRWRIRKGILRIFFYFCFNGKEFRVVFSSAEVFGREFRGFLFRGTAGIPSEITICSVYSVFRGIIFLSEIPNPRSWCKPAVLPGNPTHSRHSPHSRSWCKPAVLPGNPTHRGHSAHSRSWCQPAVFFATNMYWVHNLTENYTNFLHPQSLGPCILCRTVQLGKTCLMRIIIVL
jgi:hypothetical protein